MAYDEAIGIASSSPHICDNVEPESVNPNQSNNVTFGAVESQENNSVSLKAQDLPSQILDFLSTANNDTLGACLAGLVAITYLILGRVGLILIGVVVGIILHATWVERVDTHGSAHEGIQGLRKRRDQQAFALLERVLDWRERNSDKDGFESNRVSKDYLSTTSSTNLDFSDFPPNTGAALNILSEAVINDYVKYGYHQLLQIPRLIYLGGGIILFFPWNLPFHPRAEILLQSSWLLSLRIFHGKGRPIHF